MPIKQIKFHAQANKLLTADKKIVKIWNFEDGSLYTNIEPKSEINDIDIPLDGSGMIFAPQEQEKIGTYFLPSLGPAPKWCTFLEQLTEELEESKSTTLYEDYKFLTTLDLEKLNATNLIGTPALKAYMHGYFMELKTYQKLLSAVNPFAYEKYKKDQIKKRLEDQAEKRIIPKKSAPKANIDYVKELEQRQRDTTKKKSAAQAAGVLEDSRFSKMFEDSEFAIDRNSESYKVLKPTEGTRYKNAQAQESDEEPDAEAQAPAVNKGRNLNNLFAGKAEDSDEGPANDALSDNEGATADNFEKKMARDARKKQNFKKDKIIKNYGAIGLNQRMRELGESIMAKASSKTIKKSQQKMKKGAISESDVREKMKRRRVVVPVRKMK